MKKIFTTVNHSKRVVVVCLAVMAALMMKSEVGWGQITVTINCTGTSGSYNSGYVNSTGSIKSDGNLIVDGNATPLKRGWTTFDLSSIPASSTVTAVTLKFTVTSNTNSGVINEIHGFSGTPLTIPATTLYTNCGAGAIFNNLAWTASTTNSLSFNASGIAFISGALGTATNIGFVRGNGTAVYNINGYLTAPQPQLVITYTPPPPTITSFTPSSGCANTTSVTITGTNFTGATAVTFGGTNAASYTINSATQITATPAGGTTGTIKITTAGGTATSASTFTVNNAPSVLTYTNNTPAYCAGVTIANNTPSNTGGAATAYSVSPALPTGLSLDPSTGIISGTPTVVTAASNYVVTATNACGNTIKSLNIAVVA